MAILVWGCTAAAAAAALAAVAVAALRRIRLARLLRHWRCALHCHPDSNILEIGEIISLIQHHGLGVPREAMRAWMCSTTTSMLAPTTCVKFCLQVLPVVLVVELNRQDIVT